ncbi:hypothetical protein [Petrimonas sp.]
MNVAKEEIGERRMWATIDVVSEMNTARAEGQCFYKKCDTPRSPSD